MNYKIDFNDECKGEWEATASQFEDYSIYQTLSYQNVRCQESDETLGRVEIYDSGENLISAFLMRIKRIPLLGACIGYVQRGPLVIHKDRGLACSEEMFCELAKYLFFHGVSGLHLSFNIYNGVEGERLKAMLGTSGYGSNRNALPYHTMLFSLAPEEDDLLESFHRGWKRNIKKAIKENLSVHQDYTTEKFTALELLYKQAKERKNFKGVELETFSKTQTLLSQKEKMLVTSVYVHDEPGTILVTGTVGLVADDVLVATSEVGYRYATAYYAYWNAFLACRKKGIVRYDLGGINPEKNPSVFQFKAGTGADDVTMIGAYDIYKNAQAKLFWKAAEKIKAKMLYCSK